MRGGAHRWGLPHVFQRGKPFFLSDHFGLLGFMDVHVSYGAVGEGQSEVAQRRVVLGSPRTESAMAERMVVQDRER